MQCAGEQMLAGVLLALKLDVFVFLSMSGLGGRLGIGWGGGRA